MAKKEIIRGAEFKLPTNSNEELVLKLTHGADAADDLINQLSFDRVTGKLNLPKSGTQLTEAQYKEALEKAFKKLGNTTNLEAHQFEALVQMAHTQKDAILASETPLKELANAQEWLDAYKKAGNKATAEEGREALARLRVMEAATGGKGAIEKFFPSEYATNIRRAFATPEAFAEWDGGIKSINRLAEQISKVDFKHASMDKSGAMQKKLDEILKAYYHEETGFGAIKKYWPTEANSKIFGDAYQIQDMRSSIADFESRIAKAQAHFKSAAEDIGKEGGLNDIIKANPIGKWGSDNKARELAVSAKKNLLEEIIELRAKDPHAAAIAELHLDDDVKRSLKLGGIDSGITRASSGVGSSIESSTEKAVEKSKFPVTGILRHSEEDITKIAQKQGKTVEELAEKGIKAGNWSGKKAGIVLAIGAAVVAGIAVLSGGKKEEKSHVQREEDRRAAMPAAGMAKA